MTDLQIIQAAEELARAADKAASPRDFPMLSADQMMRLCTIARRGLNAPKPEEFKDWGHVGN